MSEIQLQATPGQSISAVVTQENPVVVNVFGIAATRVSVSPSSGSMLVETSEDGVSYTAWPEGSVVFDTADVFTGALYSVRVSGDGFTVITGKD
jgi:hypothetical protein